MHSVGFPLPVRHDAVEGNPRNAVIQMSGHQPRDAKGAIQREKPQLQIVPITFQGFKRHMSHLAKGKGTPLSARKAECPDDQVPVGVKLGSYTEDRKDEAFSDVKPFWPSSATA